MDILAVILLNVLALPIQELLSELLGVPQLPNLWLIFIVSVICWIVKYRKKFLTKQSWTSDIWLVEVSEKLLIYLWVFYFIIQAMKGSGLFTNLLAVVSEWTSRINLSLFSRPITFLLGLTLIFSVLSLCYHKKIKNKIYEKLDKDEFPEYDFAFQSNFVDFLNSDNQLGQNIYWLDGAWGTGKTYFIRTFFERQNYKAREIYYISCFGIKNRSQAEQVLLSEIEARSRLGVFSNIPVIGSLISWGFNASGLGLMKKDAILIFDDLERVVYNEQENDNPADYNDLLGFIDYFANHKNQKVIVLYNSNDMIKTNNSIIMQKFAIYSNSLPPNMKVLERIISLKQFDELINEAVLRLFMCVIKKNAGFNLRVLKLFLSRCSKSDYLNNILWKFWNNILLEELKIKQNFSAEEEKLLKINMGLEREVKDCNFLYALHLFELNYPKFSVIDILLSDYREIFSCQKIRERLSQECKNNSSLLIDFYIKSDETIPSKLHPLDLNELKFIYAYLSPENMKLKKLFEESFKDKMLKNHCFSEDDYVDGFRNSFVAERICKNFADFFEFHVREQNWYANLWSDVFIELKDELNEEKRFNIFEEIDRVNDEKYWYKMNFPRRVCPNFDRYTDSLQFDYY